MPRTSAFLQASTVLSVLGLMDIGLQNPPLESEALYSQALCVSCAAAIRLETCLPETVRRVFPECVAKAPRFEGCESGGRDLMNAKS